MDSHVIINNSNFSRIDDIEMDNFKASYIFENMKTRKEARWYCQLNSKN